MLGNRRQHPSRTIRLVAPAFVIALAVVAIAVFLAADNASAQEDPRCAAASLGELANPETGLQASGSWNTRDCQSRFRPDSDAQNFEFEVGSAGRVRIDLTSASADPYLYLLTADGVRIADNDDGGLLLDARVERNLDPGTYRVEATTTGGRRSGAADFSLTVGYVEGCEIVPLGALTPGTGLTASGSWSHETCGSRIVVAHPAHNYSFELPQPGRVRLDLVSPNGDPVLSLAAAEGAVIGANDDGGPGRNSRIEQYLPAGSYVVEATTYSRRGLQPLASDFELTVELIDELERQGRGNAKIEAMIVPDVVTAGEPFLVQYRVGNLGGGGLHEIAQRVQIQAYGAGFRYQSLHRLEVDDSNWPAGASYHTDDSVASPDSVTLEGLEPLEVTLDDAGRSWVLIALFMLDEEGGDIGLHTLWKHVEVIGRATFDPLRVSVNGGFFDVSASADDDGEVTTEVVNLADRGADVGSPLRSQAVYAAGVRSLLLDEIFERDAIVRLEELLAGAGSGGIAAGSVGGSGPTAIAARAAFAADYLASISESGLAGSSAAGVMIDPARVEGLLLANAETARQKYAALAASWRTLRSRSAGAGAISYAQALALHSQLRYAESVLSAQVEVGELVRAARTDEDGWDGAIAQRLARFQRDAACSADNRQLGTALPLAAGDADLARMLEFDSELRLALPAFGAATDRALCAVSEIDDANDRLFELLGMAASESVLLPGYRFAPTEADEGPRPHLLRIVARLHSDGRIEHAVELANGRRVLPQRRFLGADSQPGIEHSSSAVELLGQAIGTIRSHRDSAGQVLFSFLASDGTRLVPDVRILPTDASVGAWLRSSQIEVPPATPTLAAVG